GYETPTDFRLESRHPRLFPTNVRPETLEQEREWRRLEESGEGTEAEFLRFTSPVRTRYPENDGVNARGDAARRVMRAGEAEQFGVLGTSLGSCYAFIAAAFDPRIRVCAFNHASTWFGDVVWTGQSTRHIRESFAQSGLTQDDVRRVFTSISPMSYMDRFAAHE